MVHFSCYCASSISGHGLMGLDGSRALAHRLPRVLKGASTGLLSPCQATSPLVTTSVISSVLKPSFLRRAGGSQAYALVAKRVRRRRA
jgi:hypothetical protein